MREIKRFAPTIVAALLVGAAFSSIGCGGLAPPEGGESGSISPAWSVAGCGDVHSSVGFTGHYGTVTGGGIPTFTSPGTYDNCFKSYVVDLHGLEAAYAGFGAGGGNDAMLVVSWGDTVPTNQADCEATIAGAIFYQLSNNAWVPLTGQLLNSGAWAPDLLTGVFSCHPPAVSYSPLAASTTYRAAATARQGDSTMKVTFQNVPREVVH